jgi:hypothetical protein
MSHGSRSHIYVEVSSGATTYSMALGSASSRGELQCCHVFLSSGPHLPDEVSSCAATWPRPRLPERRAPVLARTTPPSAGCGPQE